MVDEILSRIDIGLRTEYHSTRLYELYQTLTDTEKKDINNVFRPLF